MTSLLIGCGNLGKIILRDFQKKKKKLIVFDTQNKVLKEIQKQSNEALFFQNLNKIKWDKLNYIMICVKPYDSKKVLKEIEKYCLEKHIIVSFVAGLKTRIISKLTKSKTKIIRVMPNIFISSNNSATAMFSENLDKNQKNKFYKDFGHFGSLVWLKQESKLDFFTAMLGGGPAYFFYILDCFNKLIKRNGFNSRDSLSLITSLLKGTLESIKQGDDDFGAKIKKVASKGGTTEEALKVFSKKNEMLHILERGINAATKKSIGISRKLE